MINRINKIPNESINKTLKNVAPKVVNQNSAFNRILNNQIFKEQTIKFSKHAESRIQTRNISFTNQQVAKINQAVTMAENKGVKDSLILVDDVALVVNIKNKTVVTVTNKNELKENIFTNIDGAVII